MTAKQHVASLVLGIVLVLAFLILVASSQHLVRLFPYRFAHTTELQLPNALALMGISVAGIALVFGFEGSPNVRSVGRGVLYATVGASILSLTMTGSQPLDMDRAIVSAPSPPDTIPGISLLITSLVGAFALRVTIVGKAAFREKGPTRLKGRRAVHGESAWMSTRAARALFPATGGIVVGEASKPDLEDRAGVKFNPRDKQTWGQGGCAPMLCFDASFGSTHGLAFAGSGGFKTTSIVIPTALKFKGSLVVLDPSTEVAPMVSAHRRKHGQTVFTLDPKAPQTGFNVLDWIGLHGNAPEQDIALVASWIMSERSGSASSSDDFFRTSAQQLITAVIADVVLGRQGPQGETNDTRNPSLAIVRQRLAQPEEALIEVLGRLHEETASRFVREIVAPFINMTPQTFSGVYGSAAKETHWLSYENYASLVSGDSFRTDDIARGNLSVFINIDLATLENHPGIARVIIGALLMAIYNRQGNVEDRALFMFDEAARLGYMRILETARDAGRKYGISLVMLFQSLGQMREAFGGRDATSKWFESASWVSFAAINDTDTAQYISSRCGTTTAEVSQIASTSQAKGPSRTRSKQLVQRPLILPHEITQMRADEQIVFASGHPPLRCGRALYFRRAEMRRCVDGSRFGDGALRAPR